MIRTVRNLMLYPGSMAPPNDRAMRAAKRIRMAHWRDPPAFAPVILFDTRLIAFWLMLTSSEAADSQSLKDPPGSQQLCFFVGQ